MFNCFSLEETNHLIFGGDSSLVKIEIQNLNFVFTFCTYRKSDV